MLLSSDIVSVHYLAAVMSLDVFILCRHFGAAVVRPCLWGNLQWESGCRNWDWRGMSRVFYTTAGTTWSSSGNIHTLRYVDIHTLAHAVVGEHERTVEIVKRCEINAQRQCRQKVVFSKISKIKACLLLIYYYIYL